MDSPDLIHTLQSPDAAKTVPPLLAAGKIDANAILGFRGTPLTVALRDENLPLARTLLEHGADPWAANLDDPPLVVAARYCSPEAIDLILSQPRSSTSDEQVVRLRDLALYSAARMCRIAVISTLLSQGADPNSMPFAPKDFDPRKAPQARDPDAAAPKNPRLNYAEQAQWGSGSALHVAARATPYEMRVWDKLRGKKPLWTEQDQVDTITAMLRHGADRSLRDEMGRTALEVGEVAKASPAVLKALQS